MKRWLLGLAMVVVAWGQSTTQTTLQNPPVDADRVVMLRLGIGDTAETKWDGSVAVTGGELVRVIGYEMRVGDFVRAPRRWEASTRPAFEFQRRPHDEGYLDDMAGPVYLTPRIYLYLRGGEDAAAEVTTAEGEFSFLVSELPVAGPKELLGGRVTAERVAMPRLAGRGAKSADDIRLTENDYPSVTVTRDGDVWVAWQGFVPNEDRVYAEKLGTGGKPHAVSGSKGDVFRSALAEDTEGKIWVVWSERRSDNWDLYARSFDGSSWSSIERLTKASQPDAQHSLLRAPDGRLHLVWQGYRNSQAVVLHKEFDVDSGWSGETRVSAAGGNCWEPSLAIDSKGNLAVAWDQYGKNGYDVKLRQRRGAYWQDVVTVAGTARFEAHATVATDGDDRVWVAWHESGANWGKDWGYPYDIREKATGLYNSRNIRMAVIENGNLRAPAQQIEEALPPGGANFYEFPQLAADGDGRVWCFFRHRRPMHHNVYNRTPSHHALWEIYASHYDGSKWSPMMLTPYSTGRNDMRIGVARTPDGGLVGTWATDRRNFRDFISSHTDVFAARFDAAGAVSTSLVAYKPEPITAETVHDDETADVARMRGYRYESGGKTYKIHRGDMHRHTEFSWDGYNDGSLEDAYRYGIDAAAMDFLAITEHNFGIEDEYNWWLLQKAADLYRVGNAFVPLFAYERSAKYPNGHRNIIFSYRGAPVLDVQHYEWGPQPAYKTQGAERLYGYLRRYKGIAMPHTSGTSMGTDWRDYDPEVEPVVEIYQSDRTSYECVDCWRAADPNVKKEQYGGYYPEGYVSEAWKKGYRLGVQASSDHLGVHTAYSMILATDNSRQSLVDAIRARHTYGATDNIVLDMRLVADGREYLMGDEAEVSSPPRFRIHVEGTRALQDVEIVKDNQRVLSRQPDGSVADFEYRDTETPGEEASFYYLRVRQKDGEIGWGSPIWVTGK
jgi:uncharacterized protein DUF3604